MLNIEQVSAPLNSSSPPLPSINTVAGAESWLIDRVRRSRRGVFAEKVVLTPQLAAALLRRNDGNRNYKPSTLNQIIADIRTGNWKLNGETIVVSEDGFLNDGQHRCKAVVVTDTAVPAMISFGVTRESRLTVDVGAARTVGDFLSMDGMANANVAASVAKMLIQYRALGRVSSQRQDKPTPMMCQNTAHAYAEEIQDAIKASPRKGSLKVGHQSLVAFAGLLLRQKDKDAADLFMARLCDGKELHGTDPIYLARERLSDPASRRLTANERLEIIFRHWNAWRKGRRMTKAAPVTGKLPSLEG